jgi:putative heme-binding domain-containing protein
VPETAPAALDAILAFRTRVLDSAAPIDGRIEAALSMARDTIGGQLLIQLAAEGMVPGPLREAAGSVIFANPDRSVRSAAAGYFPRPGGQVAMTTAAVAARAGDAARGEQRYYAAGCATCHRFGSAGADVGPELTDIRSKFDRSGLVEAIVNPNAAIAFGYAAELVVTRRQEPHIGFLLADGPTIAMRDGYGRLLSFAREDLEKRVPLKSSLMPDPLALALTEQDVSDIAAFLMAPDRR